MSRDTTIISSSCGLTYLDFAISQTSSCACHNISKSSRSSTNALLSRSRAQTRNSDFCSLKRTTDVVGRAAVCACGEARPYALIRGRSPAICFACDRIAHGRDPCNNNHVFGKANSDLIIRYPVNDHRAIFNVKQYRWPTETLENPDGDPLLAFAARYRGIHDNFKYMLDDCLREAERFEQLSAIMRQKFGALWWCSDVKEPPSKAFRNPRSKSRRERS